MKVDDHFAASGASPASDLRSGAVGGAAQTGSAGRGSAGARSEGSTDAASLSALSVQLSRALAQEPPETVARIGRLQQAVSNGTYAVASDLGSASIVSATLGEQ